MTDEVPRGEVAPVLETDELREAPLRSFYKPEKLTFGKLLTEEKIEEPRRLTDECGLSKKRLERPLDAMNTPVELIDYLVKRYGCLIDGCSSPENAKLPVRVHDFLALTDIKHDLQHVLDKYCLDKYEFDGEVIGEDQLLDNFYADLDGSHSLFVNPPYSNQAPFIEKAWELSLQLPVIMIIPANSLTCRYMDFLDEGDGEIREWNHGLRVVQLHHRTKFSHEEFKSTSGPAFACVLLLMDRKVDKYLRVWDWNNPMKPWEGLV